MLPTVDPLHVVKRDGSEEPFDIKKLTYSVAGALADAREDTAFAAALAQAAAWHLHRDRAPRVRSAELAYLMQRALEQVGQSWAAMCYANQAARRAAGRRRLRVLPTARATCPARVWDRRRWTQHIRHHGLSPSLARSLVSRVERHLLRLGLSPVSEVLIRELFACELRSCAWPQARAVAT